MPNESDTQGRLTFWWNRFTENGKFSEIAVGAISLIWCFFWLSLAFLIPEPRGESPFFWVLIFIMGIGFLVGLVATAIGFAKGIQGGGSET